MKKIKLTQGFHAIVDNDDYKYLNQFKWHVLNNKNRPHLTKYARRYKGKKNGKRIYITMHQEIMNLKNIKFEIDHKDRNGLNNQKNNLRKCTRSQNQANTGRRIGSKSTFKGVYSRGIKYVSQKRHNGRIVYLGIFERELDAVAKYNEYVKKLHGEFSLLNITND